jgi:ABC-type dipeptide/oligopeptide/nickel transport system permease subunit
MATIAGPRIRAGEADRWEMPRRPPFVVRMARPWLANPVGFIGLVIVIAFFVLGIIGPWITPYDPHAFSTAHRYEGPSWAHPFGTTRLGQDVLSRMLEGARLSFEFGLSVLVFGFIPGTALGVMSGYFGRWVDYAIQRSAEAWTALPQLVLLLVVIGAVGPGLKAVVVVLAIGALFSGSRLLRAIALIEKNKEYVFAARATGASEWRLMMRHVLPNIMPYILVGVSSVFAIAILLEATLSFLGIGVEPGTPGWGIDLSQGLKDGGAERMYLVLFPGTVITVVVLGFTLLGDTLRDILDPRLRGSTGPRR